MKLTDLPNVSISAAGEIAGTTGSRAYSIDPLSNGNFFVIVAEERGGKKHAVSNELSSLGGAIRFVLSILKQRTIE
jgi:hypothetical protein